VELRISDAENSHRFSFWNKLEVKSKDTSFVLSLHPLPSNVFLLKNPGQYFFTFHSILGDVVKKNVSVTKSSTSLDVSALTKSIKKVSKKKSFYKSIQPGDSLVILCSLVSENLSSTSLPQYEKIAITKNEQNEWIAVQYLSSSSAVNQTMKLNEKQYFEVLGNFEKKLKSLTKNKNCKKKEVYTLKYKRCYYSISDESCAWNGFTGLVAGLFATEK
jgi:hypothetical protein